MAYTVSVDGMQGGVLVTQLTGPHGRQDVEVMIDGGFCRMNVLQADDLVEALIAARQRRLESWRRAFRTADDANADREVPQ
jgi:hypothetical protein